MNLRRWKNRFLSTPWVYDTLRPIVVGGINHRLLADFCRVGERDRVFDLGCGTAQLLQFIRCGGYLGVDVDSSALKRASRFSAPHIRFLEGDDWDEAYREFAPSIVLMIGFVHHVSDEAFESIIARIRRGSPAQEERIVTLDVTYMPGEPINNLLSGLDRGRHVRHPEEYERLFLDCRLEIAKKEVLSTRLGYVRYLGYHLAMRSVS